MPTIKVFNGDRLRTARIYRGKTIAELAEEVAVTKQAISQFENGKAPGLETLLRLISALGFPREYFYEEDKEKIQVGNTYFRALLTSKKKDRMSQIEKTKIVASIYHFLNKFVEFPKLNIPDRNFNIDEIEDIANRVRQYWGLGNEPINNMVRLLEKNGLVVTSFATDGDDIDAFSQRQQVEGVEYYFVVLGDDKKSATRRQFDAAHELGHVILHDWSHDLELLSREEFRQVESEANHFAASFLLPRDTFINDLVYPSKLDYYVELKKKWRVSISAMIVRAYQLKVINNNQYQNLMKQISKKGWRSKEPLDDIIQVSKPSLMKKAVEILTINQVMSGDQIVKQLSNNNLSLNVNEIELLLGLDKGTLTSKNQSSPVVSIKKNREFPQDV
ncbi:helix-turn-helix domain-containing protein [Paenibacillus sp. FSL H8-0034]|uniref:helix-turn-helix domain-containing protein n=1 Tax=Paenibacillus sp. FSL H8-0034 TaxID=2954671 RepID=UPI0030F54BFE